MGFLLLSCSKQIVCASQPRFLHRLSDFLIHYGLSHNCQRPSHLIDAFADWERVSTNTEREVKKATRDLTNLLGGMDNANARVDAVQKKYAELLASQKRLEKENAKNKKRADLIQKEKDSVRSDFTKTSSVKDKLEKLSRELQRENKKLKVR